MEGNDTEPVTEDGTTDWKMVSVAVIILLLSTKVLEGCIMINVPVLDSTSVGIGTVVVDGNVVSEGKIVSVRSVAGVIEVEGMTEANSVEEIGVLEGRIVSVIINSLVELIEGMTVAMMMLGWLGVSTSVVIETEVEIPLESNTAGVTSNVETLIVSVKIGATDDSTPVVVGVMDKESVERIFVVGKAVTKLDNKLNVGILKLDGTSNS